MSNFDYTQYGSDMLSDEQREQLLNEAEQANLDANAEASLYFDGPAIVRDALCSALRNIDRLKAENTALNRMIYYIESGEPG